MNLSPYFPRFFPDLVVTQYKRHAHNAVHCSWALCTWHNKDYFSHELN